MKAVSGVSTRPTTDKVKEALFNLIGPYFDGGTVLDLYAGSGGLGIEALSRGAEKCIFVDKEQKAVSTVHSNLEALKMDKNCFEVYRNDAERALKALQKRDISFQFIFLDPPYKQQKMKALLEFIDENMLLMENGYVIAEQASDAKLPEQCGSLSVYKREIYGTTSITIYSKTDSRDGG